jgi:drug/metabolite transporter (DMT)-like permease
MKRYADLVLASTALVWGGMFVVAKAALDDVSSVLYLALRFTLAAAVLGVVYRRSIRWSWPAAGLGVVLMAGYILQTIGLRMTTPSKSAFLTGGYVVLVPFLSWLVYRTKTRPAEMFGVLAATIGMSLLSLQGESLTIGRGDALTIAAAMAFAVHIVLLGHLASRVASGNLAFLQVASAAVVAWLFLPVAETPEIRWAPAVVLAIVGGGLLATAFAFLAQTWAQQYLSPTRAALIFMLEPVFAWLVAWWWTGEMLTGRAAVGAGLILAGVLLVELKPNRKTAHP